MATPAKRAANHRYNQRRYETVSTRSPRVDRLNELIAIAAARTHTSRAGYILRAIHAQLDSDGIGPDDLPPLDDPT